MTYTGMTVNGNLSVTNGSITIDDKDVTELVSITEEELDTIFA